MILSLVLGFVVLIVAAWVGYTVWDDARRVREAELRMKAAELEVRAGIAKLWRDIDRKYSDQGSGKTTLVRGERYQGEQPVDHIEEFKAEKGPYILNGLDRNL